jgi:hypothetical protein
MSVRWRKLLEEGPVSGWRRTRHQLAPLSRLSCQGCFAAGTVSTNVGHSDRVSSPTRTSSSPDGRTCTGGHGLAAQAARAGRRLEAFSLGCELVSRQLASPACDSITPHIASVLVVFDTDLGTGATLVSHGSVPRHAHGNTHVRYRVRYPPDQCVYWRC